MGTVKRLAEEVERGLWNLHPKLRKTVVSKLSLAVGAMIEGQTPNTVELANLLPLETERQDMREQWLRRLLKNPLLQSEAVMEPLARQELKEASRNGQILLLSMDQTDLGDRMAVLMVCVRIGGSVTAAGVDCRGRSGQYRVRKPVHRVGTHSPMATGRGGGDVVGRPLLSVGCIVRMVASPRLVLPSTAQGQFVGRSRSWRGDDHGGAGAGGERTLYAAGAAVRRWGLDQPGDFARGRP